MSEVLLICILNHRNLYILGIYLGYTKMKRIKQEVSNEITVKNINAYFEKYITRFGNGAKIDAPKEHLGKKVIVLVIGD